MDSKADPPWTDWQGRPELHNDNVSHRARVKYSRSLYPWSATVFKVHFGGRPYQAFCYSNEKWRREKTQYRRWLNNSWRVDAEVGPGSWSYAGTVGNLDYYYLNNTVSLDDSARVDNKLRYEGRKVCGDIPSGNYNGPLMRFYLE